MTWERALEADARVAAKNAVLIRAALRQSFDAEKAFIGYQNTTPDDSLTLPQQRVRARAWAIMNIRPNLEPLRQVLYKLWADGYVLGDLAARVEIAEAKRLQKADTASEIDWSKWKPGDKASAVLLKPPRAFQRLLENAGLTLKGFSDTTLTDIGNAVGEAIELGLDAKTSAKNIMNHVANPARALSIAITEQNRAISAATANRYREAGLQQMEWLVFDPCKICAQNQNKRVSIGAPFPSGDTQPPAHPHCRCALAPVIPGFDDPANTGGNVTTGDPATNTSYRMQHQAPSRDGGILATDIESGMPDASDPKLQMAIYGTGDEVSDRESFAALNRIQGNPEAMVTIYRAVPGDVNTINRGDWVTLSPNYANQHKDLYLSNENGKVISMKVRAGDLFTDGNSINEFGFDPTATASAPLDPATLASVKAAKPDYTAWKKEELLEFTEIKDLNPVEKEVFNGASKEYIKIYTPLEDTKLKAVLEKQGFTAKPTVLPAAKIDELGATLPKMYRGVNDFDGQKGSTFVTQFKKGEMFVGRGVIGNGIYAGSDYNYVIKYAKDKPENVMTMILKPDAKIIDFADADKKSQTLVKAFNAKADKKETFISLAGLEDYMSQFNELTPNQLRDIGYLFTDPGRYAALNGYDAIRYADADGSSVYVLLNRGAVAVSE